jgi:hypothetical protein
MGSHNHTHGLAKWPFADSEDLGVFLCEHVFDRSLPILFVTHDHDGDWQFLCGEHTHEDGKPRLVCFGCIISRDPSLIELADMPRGWGADRATATDAWNQGPLPKPDDDDGFA